MLDETIQSIANSNLIDCIVCLFYSGLKWATLGCFYLTWICRSEGSEEPNREPVNNLDERNKTDPKAKSTDATQARDEVQPGHFWRSLEFWNISVISVSVKWYSWNSCVKILMIDFISYQMLLNLQRICLRQQCLFRRHCRNLIPE